MSNPLNKPAVRIVKHIGPTPCVAACTACGRQFQAPTSVLRSVAAATTNLQEQFDRHKCEGVSAVRSDPEPPAQG